MGDIKKIKSKEILVKADKKKKQENKNSKKESAKKPPEIKEIIEEERPEDITQILSEELGDLLQEDIDKDQEQVYPSNPEYKIEDTVQAMYLPEEKEPEYRSGKAYEPSEAYQTEHKDIDEEINLHKKIKKYLRG